MLRIIFATTILLLVVFIQSSYSQKTLKDVFQEDFLIGASLNQDQFSGNDETAASIVRREFNTISPENVLKWESVEPEVGMFDFRASDRYVEFGQRNGLKVIGHTLVWHNQTPKNVFYNDSGELVGKKELSRRMRNHIFTVVGRYKGRIHGWDVVNEALNDDGTLRESLWLKIIGPEYIELAFRFAKEADPSAELYYNDYSLELPAKRDGAVALIKELQSKGVPIHGIGSQGHNTLEFPSIKLLDDSLSEFAKLGIKVMITELDVSVLPNPEGFNGAEVTVSFENRVLLDPYREGLPEAVERDLANRYVEIFRVFRKHKEAISRVTFWNVTDKESWLNNFPVRGRTNYPLLFDREGNPKQAFLELIRTF